MAKPRLTIPTHAYHFHRAFCSGVNVSSNILGGATQGGVYFHQGGLNTAQNNIIVDGTQYQARKQSSSALFSAIFPCSASICNMNVATPAAQLCLGTADQIASVLRSNIFVWRNPAAKVFCDFNVMPGKTSRDDILRALAYSDYNLYDETAAPPPPTHRPTRSHTTTSISSSCCCCCCEGTDGYAFCHTAPVRCVWMQILVHRSVR
eukprot:SAG11_NODE_1998_length_3943_cov_6.764828_4_plen_206_part_00